MPPNHAKSLLILGIETSCDESGVALYHTQRGLLGHKLHSQVAMHADYGGVVPELASRDHIRRVLPLTGELLAECGLALSDLNAIAYTQGPGLAGALLVGASIAHGLAYALDIPAIGIHHLEGHLLSPLLAEPAPTFPFVALLVSGGHTQLMRVGGVGDYQLLGETVDDAAGEAFDKGAKLLGLPYPGGALIEKHAQQGDVRKFVFPRGIPEKADLRLSFSGLKTALRYQLEKMSDADVAAAMPDLCAGYQHAIIEQLVSKTGAVLDLGGYKSVGLSGGVANNRTLRSRLTNAAQQRGLPMLVAEPKHCGDNAGMIAFAAWADVGLPVGAAAVPAASLTVDQV